MLQMSMEMDLFTFTQVLIKLIVRGVCGIRWGGGIVMCSFYRKKASMCSCVFCEIATMLNLFSRVQYKVYLATKKIETEVIVL